MTAEPTQCWVYIIGPSQGPVKVGHSGAPESRVRQLQPKSYERLILLGAYPVGQARALAVERYAHWLLREHALGGEWFNTTVEVAAQAIHDAIATDVHPNCPMPEYVVHPKELRGGKYMRTKLSHDMAQAVHEASGGQHSAFIREAVAEKLERENKP